MGSENAVINVMLEKGEVVNFKRIIFAHSGLKLQEKFIEARSDVQFRKKACVKALREFEITRNMDTVICVNGGGVILRECTLSLKSLPKKLNQKFASVVSFP